MSLGFDPLTQNRYSLAGGNPINFVEVDGHRVIPDGGGGGSSTPQPKDHRSGLTAQQTKEHKECAAAAYTGKRQTKSCAYLRGVVRQRHRVSALEGRYASAVQTEMRARRGEQLVPTGYGYWPDSVKEEWLTKQSLMSAEEMTDAVSGAVLGTKAAKGAVGATKAIGPGGNPGAFPKVTATRNQLEKKFKHAGDLGVTEAKGAAGFKAFERAINDFVAAPGTIRTLGAYRQKSAILNFNPSTRVAVVQSPTGEFITNMRMSPAQTQNVLERGSLGGG